MLGTSNSSFLDEFVLEAKSMSPHRNIEQQKCFPVAETI